MIPAADTINDVVQTIVRPVAGGVLVAASAGIVSDIHPVLALACGLLVAGTIHAVKASARPAITATTGGIGNPVLSTAEDIVSGILSVLAIVVPIFVALIILLLLGLLVFWLLRRRRRHRETQMPGWF
jgi:heme/copper-type cytochrome/quinol oxidase subunit 2